MSIVIPKSRNRFVLDGVYTRGLMTPASYSGNLLSGQNRNFNGGIGSWVASGGSPTLNHETDDPIHGAGSIEIISDGIHGASLAVDPAEADQEYYFAAIVRGEVGERCRISVNANETGFAYIETYAATPLTFDGTDQLYELTFTTHVDTDLIVLYITPPDPADESTITFYADNVELRTIN